MTFERPPHAWNTVGHESLLATTQESSSIVQMIQYPIDGLIAQDAILIALARDEIDHVGGPELKTTDSGLIWFLGDHNA
jgi:collagenase-like PrtC family protease